MGNYIISPMKDGILFIDKEAGMTSRQVDNAIQHLFHTRKVGHLGTLDPFATGLLVVSIGKGGKFLPFLDDGNKCYLASLKLGASSSTGDHDGEIKDGVGVPSLDANKVKEALDSFLGKSSQLPPMTSAIKIDGKALYKYAHKGEEIERKPREIEVFQIGLIRFEDNVIDFVVQVSKGTYIRTLGEDIAKKLGTEGYLLSLRRLSVGRLDLRFAKPLSEINEDDILDPTPFCYTLPHVEVTEEEAVKVKNGVKLDLEKDYGEKAMLTRGGVALAVYERNNGTIYTSCRGLF
ncbi:MAG: tRNA pseudouridine(55) synthase TruB [Candidatus Enteromonas sp.]|nr:tRNA pseudouridine(55) synthase TruB [Candidatus Enteromonas sp.]